MRGILDGIRVVDWTQWHTGPFATAMLADLGAEVIHVEHPKSGDGFRGLHPMFSVPMTLPNGRHIQFEDLNRNKKGLTLDVKTPKGKEIMYRLVEKSDVFVTNFRGPEKAGMGYETLSSSNPRLIYAHCTGFGLKGPDSQRASYELIGYARSGAMFGSGEEGMPPVYITPGLGDRTAAVFLAYGLMSALLARERLGVSQKVTVSQLGAMIVLQGTSVMASVLGGREFDRQVRTEAKDPLNSWYRCKDDRWIALSMFQSDRYWSTFCSALGIPEVEKDPRFASSDARMQNCVTLVSVLDKVFATRTCEEWLDSFRQAGDLIYSPINRISDLASDPQVIANNFITEWDHPDLGPIKFVGFPVEFSETPARFERGAPQFGEHTSEILQDLLGYGLDEIANLYQSGVV